MPVLGEAVPFLGVCGLVAFIGHRYGDRIVAFMDRDRRRFW